MATFLSCKQMSMLLLALAMCLQLHCTIAQLRQSGPPLRPSNVNTNSNPNPIQNQNQNLALNPNNVAGNRQGRNLPRSANSSAPINRSQTARPASDQNAAANNNNKVSVQLSRAIAQDQTDVMTDDRSFANPTADRVEEHVVLDGTNVTSTGATPVSFPPPQRQHFKPGKLLAQLDNEFDPLWLSIERPAVRVERPPAASVVPDTDLADRVSALNFSLFTLYDSLGQPLQPQPGLVSLFKTWLHRYSTCQMEYFWEEMDINFWPRYIKRGMCVNDQPCSWPPGMRCKASRSKSLRVLRWVCKTITAAAGGDRAGRTIIKRDSSDGTVPSAIRIKPSQGQNANRNRNAAVGNGNGNGQKKKQQNGDRQKQKKNRNNGKKNMNNRRRKEKRDAFYNDPDITYLVDDTFCQWEPVTYTVVDKCSCSCAIN